MRPSTFLLPAALSALSSAQSFPPGYNGFPNFIPSTVPSNETISFGSNYAVLNLDLINLLVGDLAETEEGAAWISNVETWIDTIHALPTTPLTIFTRIFFTNENQPELGPEDDQVPFAQAAGALGSAADNNTEIFPTFTVDNETDITLTKTRYYSGAGNALEQILRAQQIDTVILSGVRTSGVILSTTYQLFDLDYKVYVIANNTIETPDDAEGAPEINEAILTGIIPKLPADVITIEQAIAGVMAGSNSTSLRKH